MTRVEAARKGGQATFAKYGSQHMSRIGQSGYIGAIFSNPDFHKQGGTATATIDRYTDPTTGAVGLQAAIVAGYQPRKRHRYLGPCECCKRSEQPGRYPGDAYPLRSEDFYQD